MSKEKKMLYSVETTQITDPTKGIGCGYCPLNYTCRFYHTICELKKNKIHFGAKLLCTLLKADSICTKIFKERLQSPRLYPLTTAQEVFALFLPAINNNLEAFYKYDCDNAPNWAKNAIIKILEETLDTWECLDDFDFMFSKDVRETSKQIISE